MASTSNIIGNAIGLGDNAITERSDGGWLNHVFATENDARLAAQKLDEKLNNSATPNIPGIDNNKVATYAQQEDGSWRVLIYKGYYDDLAKRQPTEISQAVGTEVADIIAHDTNVNWAHVAQMQKAIDRIPPEQLVYRDLGDAQSMATGLNIGQDNKSRLASIEKVQDGWQVNISALKASQQRLSMHDGPLGGLISIGTNSNYLMTDADIASSADNLVRSVNKQYNLKIGMASDADVQLRVAELGKHLGVNIEHKGASYVISSDQLAGHAGNVANALNRMHKGFASVDSAGNVIINEKMLYKYKNAPSLDLKLLNSQNIATLQGLGHAIADTRALNEANKIAQLKEFPAIMDDEPRTINQPLPIAPGQQFTSAETPAPAVAELPPVKTEPVKPAEAVKPAEVAKADATPAAPAPKPAEPAKAAATPAAPVAPAEPKTDAPAASATPTAPVAPAAAAAAAATAPAAEKLVLPEPVAPAAPNTTTPPASTGGNLLTDNIVGIGTLVLSGLGMYLFNMDPMIGGGIALLLAAVGGALGDKNGMFAGLLPGSGKKDDTQSPGQSREVAAGGAAVTRAQGAPAASTDVAPTSPGEQYTVSAQAAKDFADRVIDKTEFDRMLKDAKINTPDLAEVSKNLLVVNGPKMDYASAASGQKGYLILTPEAKVGDTGPVIYAEYASKGTLANIQVSMNGKSYALDGEYASPTDATQQLATAQQILADIRANKGKEIKAAEAKVDDITTLLQPQLTPVQKSSDLVASK